MKTQTQQKAYTRELQVSPIHPEQIVGQIGDGVICYMNENRHLEWEATAQRIVMAMNLLSQIEKEIELLKSMKQELPHRLATRLADLKELINQE